MKTQIYKATPENLQTCARLLQEGESVAIPTETVYGLGGNALDESSVKKIYTAKGRPSDNPLIVHIADKSDVSKLAREIPKKAQIIIDSFMPGPITVVLPKSDIIPSVVTGGLDTVAIRMPENEIAREIIRLSGCPVCAPSANTSTRPSPTTAQHVYDDLNGKILAIVDGGECQVGVESTVIGFNGETPRLLRAGGMALEKIEEKVGKIEIVRSSKVALCPGMKYKHYSPTAQVYLLSQEDDAVEKLTSEYDEMITKGERPVIVCQTELVASMGNRNTYDAGKDVDEYARNLFALLRKSDEDGYTAVLCQSVKDDGLGLSVMNRLEKASGGNRI